MAVSEGLAAGDKVIVTGLQRIGPGVDEVKAKEVSLGPLTRLMRLRTGFA
jgi:hypothetical protein